MICTEENEGIALVAILKRIEDFYLLFWMATRAIPTFINKLLHFLLMISLEIPEPAKEYN
jgi:hypothetical protein